MRPNSLKKTTLGAKSSIRVQASTRPLYQPMTGTLVGNLTINMVTTLLLTRMLRLGTARPHGKSRAFLQNALTLPGSTNHLIYGSDARKSMGTLAWIIGIRLILIEMSKTILVDSRIVTWWKYKNIFDDIILSDSPKVFAV